MKKYIYLVAIATILCGCKTTESQYYYGEYTSAVYSYFKAEEVSVEEQIRALEKVIEDAQTAGKPIAPGIHAHLGMLYFETGNSEQGIFHFDVEKNLFPESTKYLDFLISSAKKV